MIILFHRIWIVNYIDFVDAAAAVIDGKVKFINCIVSSDVERKMHKLLLLLDTNSQKKMNSRKKNTDIDDDGDTSLSVKMLNFSLVKICKFI